MGTTARGTAFQASTERLVHLPSAPVTFSEDELEGLPDAVARYLRGSIAIGTPLARSARLRMRGSIKLGRMWLPFRARQVLAPLHGFIWAARVAAAMSGSDSYAEGSGAMEWKLFGLIRLISVQGPDLSRSSTGRAGAESVWVPTALLPRFGVAWTATDAHHATASYRLDDTDLELHYTFDDDARVCAVALDRWGDPTGDGTWGHHRFEHRLNRYTTFDGVTIPSAGHGSWLVGGGGWSEGEFFRYEISDYRLVTAAPGER